MVYCLPATQCCCGCTVSIGVKFILILHLMFSVYTVVSGWVQIMADIQYPNPVPSANALGWSAVLSGYALAGIPIILMALWGSIQKIETLVRVYLWFATVSIFIDLIYFADHLLVDPCGNLPEEFAQMGNAYMCGAARFFDWVGMLVIIGIQVYILHIVWSYCEDLAEGGGADMADLARDLLGRPVSQMMLRHKKMQELDPYLTLPHAHDGEQQAGLRTCCPGMGYCLEQLGCDLLCGGLVAMTGFGTNPEYSSTYSNFSSGVGTSTRIFNGKFHELQYPPPHKPNV